MSHHHVVSLTRRSNAPSDDDRSVKRQKVYRACLGCVNSKTRCEDVVPSQGCLRCRSKQKDCSLVESGIGLRPSADRDPVDAELEARVHATEEGWRALSQRVDRLEQGLYAVGNDPSTSTSGNPTQQQQPPPPTPSTLSVNRPVGVNRLYSSLLWNRICMSETVFNVSSEAGYPDPVARGLITMDQMEMSFHLFKHRFTNLVPLAPFLLSTTPLPQHPFVRLAILAFTNPPTDHPNLLEEAILTVSAGAVHGDVVLALYILSLAPGPTDTSRAPLTPLRMISMAYSVGQAMGLDAVSEMGLRSKWLLHPAWSTRLDQVLLWEAVKNRYNILIMMHGRNTYLAPCLLDSLGEPALTEYHPSVRHLKLEAEMIGMFVPLLRPLSLAEVEVIEDIPDPRLGDHWSHVSEKLSKWTARLTDPHGLLRYDADSLRFSFAFRISCVIQCTPSPVAPDKRIGGLSHSGVNLLTHAVAMCELFNTTPEARLPLLPAYLGFELTVVMTVLRRSLAYMKSQGHNWDLVNESVFDTATSNMMTKVGNLPAKMLEMTEDPQLDNRFPELDFDTLFGSLPADWLQAFGLGPEWLAAADHPQPTPT